MSVFDATTEETPASYLEALVGEGKKFSDPESLARGKWEADRHAAKLEAELAEARDAAREAKTVEELLAKIQGQQTPAPRTPDPVAHQPAEPAALTQESIAELVRNELNQSRSNDTKNANVSQVASKLVEMYGTEEAANTVVKAKAAELGVSVEFLQSVAVQSPKAFFAQIGLDTSKAPSAPGPTIGTVNAQALDQNRPGTAKPATYAFYEEIRKSNPGLYASVQIQTQMHKDALSKGEAFFN